MLKYFLQRLFYAALTVLGVMIITFFLFRAMAGDIASAHLGNRAPNQLKADWLHIHGYDKPLFVNIHNRIIFNDNTTGDKPFSCEPVGPQTDIAETLGLFSSRSDSQNGDKLSIIGKYSRMLSVDTPLNSVSASPGLEFPVSGNLAFSLADGSRIEFELRKISNVGELIGAINSASQNKGKITVGITEWKFPHIIKSQFADHLVKSVTFSARSLVTNQKLTEIIKTRAPMSLAITVPSMAMGWVAAMIISCFVAYFRNTWIDKIGVLLSVLGMCVPFLAFMIYGQWVMFKLSPAHAYGTFYRSNLYLPIAIMVIAGLGGSVRFYRTVILDEVNRDYVRTARAKGVPLPTILFKHVLKNCMLPILTNLIMSLPFLIMGNLLVENYFGIPGLGDLMITSITSRDEPIINAIVFLLAMVYTIGVILTDTCYGLFDPRIRLR